MAGASNLSSAKAAAAIAVAGAATILGAWFFQFVIGLKPCPLCLEQRIPYYLAIVVAAVVAFVAAKDAPPTLIKLGFGLLVLILLVSVGLGAYHAGIEWKFWAGPTECTGELGSFSGGDLMKQIQTTSVVRCDEAAWRFLGLSLAGYNALISLALAAIAAFGFAAARKS
jgi:disulfide bond formation protein DsbB